MALGMAGSRAVKAGRDIKGWCEKPPRAPRMGQLGPSPASVPRGAGESHILPLPSHRAASAKKSASPVTGALASSYFRV